MKSIFYYIKLDYPTSKLIGGGYFLLTSHTSFSIWKI